MGRNYVIQKKWLGFTLEKYLVFKQHHDSEKREFMSIEDKIDVIKLY